MSTNGHTKSVRERLVSTLKLNGGQLSLRDLVRDYRFTRHQLDDEFEQGGCPFAIAVRNGNGKPATTMVILKNFRPLAPVSQDEIAVKLNSMSREDYYAMLDPTYRLRHKRRSGGGCRTSTSADEYLNQNGEGFR